MTTTRRGPASALLGRRARLVDRALRWAFVAVLVAFVVLRPTEAGDARAYWLVDIADPYARPVATQDAFTYPPPAAIAFWVLGHLPWEAFQAGWTLLIGLALLWLTGPWALAFLVVPVVASDLYLGNIHVLLAAAVVGAFRRPALWAFPLLTKPTVGVGLLWYVVRREWRPLAVAVGVTAVIVVGSWLVAPGLWPAWIDYVLATGASPDVGAAWWIPLPLVLRLPVAVLVVVWGARTDRPWTVPVAGMLALPVLWLVGLAMLAGAFALSRWGPQRALASRATPTRAPDGPAAAAGETV